ncbi:MAG: hypothetical protein ACKVOU_01720 [Cytophagales bacterium]
MASTFNLFEKIGLSFIIGIAVQSFLAFLASLIGISVSLISVLTISIIVIAVFGFLSFRKDKKVTFFSFSKHDHIQLSFAWIAMIGLLGYLIYGASVKCLFWPVAEYDSMTGYDLMGKMIANEGTFDVSIFQYPFTNAYDVARFIYPPLVATGFAYFYLLGVVNAKIYVLCLFISFIVAFYGLLKNKVSDTLAIFITLLMMITPEMFSHASLGLTNLPNAIYTSLSFLCFYYWLQNKSNSYFIISLLLMAASMWSRSDSIAFVAGYGLIFFIEFFKTKEWLKPLVYIGTCFAVFMIWNLFIKINVGANSSDFFVKTLFWDGEKFNQIFSRAFGLMLGNGQLYGLTFYVFVVFLALNIVDITLTVNRLVLFTLSTWVLYTLLYYQIDYGFAGSIDAYLNASYKRGLFNFVPLAWFFVGVSPMSEKWFGKLNVWLYK